MANTRHSRQASATSDGAATLRDVLDALDSTVVELVDAPRGAQVHLRTAALVDETDLAFESESRSRARDLYLLAGVAAEAAARWIETFASSDTGTPPVAVMTKYAQESSTLQAAAHRAGVALVALNPQARWDHVFPLVQRVLARTTLRPVDAPGVGPTDTDLFELAQVVARSTHGMVSIEDAHSRVLAYSPSDDTADALRRSSILGRGCPQEFLNVLSARGVFDQIRGSDRVIEVPADAELKIKRRLVVGVRDAHGRTKPRVLGSIWLQEGSQPLAPDAAHVLQGASAVAARVISRTADAPSAEIRLVKRLLGADGGGVDVPSVASALGLPLDGPAAVVGLAPLRHDGTLSGSGDLASMLRLHASAFRRDAVAAVWADRAYVMLPGYRSERGVSTWVRQLVEQFELRHGIELRAALVIPVPGLHHVASARAEADRVLEGIASDTSGQRVTTLAESRTAVLVDEIMGLVAQHTELCDPRIDALLSYDSAHDSELHNSVAAHLQTLGDVRAAARQLQVHPNTLRYRLRRAEEIMGMSLADPRDRLLLQIQLAVLHRTDRPKVAQDV